MALSEVFVALQTGVMDGQENPLAQIYPSRFQEVQKYLSMSGHVYTPAYVTAGRSWAKLPPDVQKIVKDTAVEMRSEEHTSELQSLMRISYAVFCLKKKIQRIEHDTRGNKQ